jgi:hypothetical protein
MSETLERIGGELVVSAITWHPDWPILGAERRGHLRRVWLAPDHKSSDSRYWPHDPCWVDPTQVVAVSCAMLSPNPTSFIRLRGLIVPLETLGAPEHVFFLLDLWDPLAGLPPVDPRAFGDPHGLTKR